MSSFANLSSVVDKQGDTAPWPSDQSWDPPPEGMICTGSLSDTRLHSQNSARPRQEWEWSDSQMILASAPRYVTEGEELDTKTSALNVEALGGSGLGLRHYGGEGLISAVSSMLASPSMERSGSAVQSTAWPRLLNAVQLRQAGGLESTSASCFATPPLMSIHAGNAAGSDIDAGLGMYYNHSNQSQILGMDNQRRMQDILKKGLYTGSGDVASGRLGLNLGGRTYFSAEDMGAGFHFPGMVMGKRFRPNSPSFHVPLCQAEGCKADLSVAKHYHRRHKVCEYHSKAATVAISGNPQRFCQQCSRFHALAEFDEGKRSCRKRLADHNRRRRKPQPASAGSLGDSAAHATSMSTEKTASKLSEDESTELVGGIIPTARAQSEKQDVLASEKNISKVNQKINSSPMEKQSPRLLSPMKLAPPVSLALQNGGCGSETRCDQASSLSARSQGKSGEEAGYVNQEHAAKPHLLNGPSLSLSSNNAASASNGRISARGKYFNERGRLLAEGMQNVDPRVSEKLLQDPHNASQMENWTLQGAVPPEGQSVLTLLETSDFAASRKKESRDYRQQIAATTTTNFAEDHHHFAEDHHHDDIEADHRNGGAKHLLDFLQQQHHSRQHLSSKASGSDHQASDATHSLHCMQVLRPLNESIYSTADSIKDSFG